jgi:DNA-binding winged helix-turn-helix (wHTH) protein
MKKRAEHTGKMKELYEILNRGGVSSSDDLSDELGIDKSKVRLLISSLRDRFRSNDESVELWIYTTKGGYTVDEKPEHVMYESRLRLQLGIGAIVNGAHVFKRAKMIASSNYSSMMLEFKPKALIMGSLIK